MTDSILPDAQGPALIALVQERVTVDTAVEETGAVRVRVVVDTHDEPVALERVVGQVCVERVPVDRVVDRRRAPWQDGDVTVIPVYAEVAVVERRLVLQEEIRLHLHTRSTVTEQQVPVRRQRAVVERRLADGRWVAVQAAAAGDGPPRAGPGLPGHPDLQSSRSMTMGQTVVGVFDRYAEAERAAQQLRESGFEDSVQVTERLDDETARTAGPADASAPTSAAQDEGVFAHVRNFFSSIFGSDDDHEVGAYAEAVRRGGGVVKVEVEQASEVEAARAALLRAGAVDLDERADAWRAAGWRDDAADVRAGTSAGIGDDLSAGPTVRAGEALAPESSVSASTSARGADVAGAEEVVPVVREELQVGKRTVTTGGVRIYARTVETPVTETVSLRSERAVVDRRPVDRPATEADLDALGETTIEVRETTEQPVVGKEARVVEEVRVGKVVEHHTQDVTDTVRNTEVAVEPIEPQRRDLATDSGGDDDFRSHFQSRLAASGSRFEDYEPAYRYGAGLSADSRYSGRSWDTVEPDLRRDWERSHPGSDWERFKSAVRHGWERLTG